MNINILAKLQAYVPSNALINGKTQHTFLLEGDGFFTCFSLYLMPNCQIVGMEDLYKYLASTTEYREIEDAIQCSGVSGASSLYMLTVGEQENTISCIIGLDGQYPIWVDLAPTKMTHKVV